MNKLHLTPLGPNMNEVRIGTTYVLFSYQQPVAYRDSQGVCSVTEEKWSRTTTKHISQWVGDYPYREVPQSDIDQVVAGGGTNGSPS